MHNASKNNCFNLKAILGIFVLSVSIPANANISPLVPSYVEKKQWIPPLQLPQISCPKQSPSFSFLGETTQGRADSIRYCFKRIKK
jgi:hypothetical protein